MATSVTNINASSGSGLDVDAIVEQLLYVERAPERLLQTQQLKLDTQTLALTDLQSKLGTLVDKVNQLNEFSGAIGSMVAQSSDSSAFTATATSAAESGTHTVSVENLASTSSAYSDPLATADTSFGGGSLVLAIGKGTPVTVTFDATHSTLKTAADYINSLKVGIAAHVVTDSQGSRLAVVSNSAGAAGDLTVQSAPAGLGFTIGQAGKDAKVIIDGIPVYSSTNSITGALAGVTIDATSARPGAQLKLTVAPDEGRAKAALQNFVTAYNNLYSAIDSQFQYNATTKSSGVLGGDPSVRGLQASLLSMMSYQSEANPTFKTLKSIGIDMENDGTLSIDDTVLSAALDSHPDEVASFLQSTTPDGFSQHLSIVLSSMDDSMDGPLSLDIQGIENTGRSITDSIDDIEARIDMRRQVLLAQYSRLDSLLRQLPTIQAQISAQLESTKS